MANSVGAPLTRIPKLKQLMLAALKAEVADNPLFAQGILQPGVLIDDTYGQNALNEVTGASTGTEAKNPWWIGRPVEVPASRPLELEGGRSIGSRLVSWPRQHIVKCLVLLHPADADALWQQQIRQLDELYRACAVSGHELLIEVIPPAGSTTSQQELGVALTQSLQMIYQHGVRPDWWKLPAPDQAGWAAISDLIQREAPHCRGVILLGLDAPADSLIQAFRDSSAYPICRGFAIGRTIFGQPALGWFGGELTDHDFQQQIRSNYRRLVQAWLSRHDHSTHLEQLSGEPS